MYSAVEYYASGLFSSCNPAYGVVLCRSAGVRRHQKNAVRAVLAGATAPSVRDAPACSFFVRRSRHHPFSRAGMCRPAVRPAGSWRNTAILRHFFGNYPVIAIPDAQRDGRQG